MHNFEVVMVGTTHGHRRTHKKVPPIDRVSNRKYESLQIQSTTVFPSRSTLGMIETIPQIGKALEKFAPNAILNC